MRAARLPPEFVQARANCDAIEPALYVIALGSSIAPEFQKHFHSKFLGARGVADNSRNDAGNSPKISAKKSLDIELCLRGIHSRDGFAWCVHNIHNAARGKIVTGFIGTANLP